MMRTDCLVVGLLEPPLLSLSLQLTHVFVQIIKTDHDDFKSYIRQFYQPKR